MLLLRAESNTRRRTESPLTLHLFKQEIEEFWFFILFTNNIGNTEIFENELYRKMEEHFVNALHDVLRLDELLKGCAGCRTTTILSHQRELDFDLTKMSLHRLKQLLSTKELPSCLCGFLLDVAQFSPLWVWTVTIRHPTD